MLTSASLRVRACAWLRPPPAKGWCLWHSSRGKSRRHAGNSRGRQGGGLTAVTGEIPMPIDSAVRRRGGGQDPTALGGRGGGEKGGVRHREGGRHPLQRLH